MTIWVIYLKKKPMKVQVTADLVGVMAFSDEKSAESYVRRREMQSMTGLSIKKFEGE